MSVDDDNIVVTSVVGGPADNGKEPCPECGKLYMPGPGMGVHRASMHGTINKTTGAGRQRKECPECHKWFSSKDYARHLRRHGVQPRVGRPPKQEPLTPDEIVRTVCAMLWPKGIPPDKLDVLLIWHRQTAEFLEQAQE